MESQDYDLVKQEQKEQQDREIYQDLKEQFEQAIDDCISRAKKDELEIDDIIEAVQNGLDDNLSLSDGIYTIKRVKV